MRMTHSNRRDICTESAYGQRQTNGHESIRHRKYKIATMKLKIFMFATCIVCSLPRKKESPSPQDNNSSAPAATVLKA